MKRAALISVCLFASLLAQNKGKVYITDEPSSNITETSQSSVYQNADFSTPSGRQSVQIKSESLVADAMEHFRGEEHCKDFELTIKKEEVDYIFLFGRQNGYRENVIVLDQEGQILHAGDSLRFKNTVKDACKVIEQEWGKSDRLRLEWEPFSRSPTH